MKQQLGSGFRAQAVMESSAGNFWHPAGLIQFRSVRYPGYVWQVVGDRPVLAAWYRFKDLLGVLRQWVKA